jgi:hypothetical protein
MLDWIRQSAEQDTPLTKEEIKNYCTTQFRISMTRGWLNSFVLRHSGDVVQTTSTQQEAQRSQVPRAFLERTIWNFNGHVQGCVVKLVFNLDELGISD